MANDCKTLIIIIIIIIIIERIYTWWGLKAEVTRRRRFN